MTSSKAATGIDRRERTLFSTCFTADVVAEYDGIATWTDLEAITAFMVDAHAGMGHLLHRPSNLAVEVHGDTATARSYVDAVLPSAGAGGLRACGWYDDELVRTADGWRIAHRRFTMVQAGELGT